jgi:hypothetical protein
MYESLFDASYSKFTVSNANITSIQSIGAAENALLRVVLECELSMTNIDFSDSKVPFLSVQSSKGVIDSVKISNITSDISILIFEELSNLTLSNFEGSEIASNNLV